MARRRKQKVYWRNRGGTPRAYADFRDYTDVGGRQEALIPPAATLATTDPDVARKLVAARLEQLEERRRRRV